MSVCACTRAWSGFLWGAPGRERLGPQPAPHTGGLAGGGEAGERKVLEAFGGSLRLGGSGAEAGLRGRPWEDPRCRDLECSPKVLGAGTGPSYLGRGQAFCGSRFRGRARAALWGLKCRVAVWPLQTSRSPLPQPGARAPWAPSAARPAGRGKAGPAQDQVCRPEAPKFPDPRAGLEGWGTRIHSDRCAERRSPSVPVFKWQGATRGL